MSEERCFTKASENQSSPEGLPALKPDSGPSEDDQLARRLWPRCGVCDRPVQRVRRYYDNLHCQMILRAECHGEHEETVLTDEFLEGLERMSSLRGGVAFAPALPAAAVKADLAPKPRRLA